MLSGLVSLTSLASVTGACGTFNSGNPLSISSSSPTGWNTAQSQLLTAQYLAKAGCLPIVGPTGVPPYQISLECTSNCGAAPVYPLTACTGCLPNSAQASINTTNWIVFAWGSASSTGIVGTSSYPIGATITVRFSVYFGTLTTQVDNLYAYAKFGPGVGGSAYDFTISASPASVTVPVSQTQTAVSTITITGQNGYPGPTSLSVSCSSTSVTVCALNPTTVTGGSGSSVLSLGSTCCTGVFSATVTGTYTSTSGNLVHSTNPISVQITGAGGSTTPDWTINAAPSTVSFPVGGTGIAGVSIAALNGFTGTVSLTTTVQANSVGGTCTINPTSATLTSTTTAVTATLSLGATSPGTFTCNINGSSGTGGSAISHTLSVVAVSGLAGTGPGPVPFSFGLTFPLVLVILGGILVAADVLPGRKR